ncbi:MAG: hypothetical protein HUJ26_13500 [Planctomycetaceae bacterium]|nr:hypothetical protein [Planctomycetaceae bacterium]
MNQNDLNRAVSRATGETVSRVKQRGFQLEQPSTANTHTGQMVDWDRLESVRWTSLFQQASSLAAEY